jgi:hypothetical protein
MGNFWRALQWKMLVYFMDNPLVYFRYGHLVYFTYNHLVYFMDIFCGYLVTFFPVLICCTKKNLATLSLAKTLRRSVLTGHESFMHLSTTKRFVWVIFCSSDSSWRLSILSRMGSLKSQTETLSVSRK